MKLNCLGGNDISILPRSSRRRGPPRAPRRRRGRPGSTSPGSPLEAPSRSLAVKPIKYEPCKVCRMPLPMRRKVGKGDEFDVGGVDLRVRDGLQGRRAGEVREPLAHAREVPKGAASVGTFTTRGGEVYKRVGYRRKGVVFQATNLSTLLSSNSFFPRFLCPFVVKK